MSTIAAVRGVWPLFLGIALLMLGNGLQGTLLGVRALMEGFSTQVTGVVMTGYFAGFLAGSTIVPRLVKNVGHIRVFAALASLLSAAVLAHSILISPSVWFVIRLVSGFAAAGLYVVAESWLNDAATNRTRGALLSVYMVVVLGGMGAGQLLLNLADPGGFELFILISVLVSLALVPISLTVSRAPAFEAPEHVGFRALYYISPLGIVGCLVVGIAHSTLLGMGAVYASRIGLSVPDVSLFMSMALLGGVAIQWPVGHLSDVFDRRQVIAAVTLVAAAVALVGLVAGGASKPLLLVVVFLFGGLSFAMYSLCVAHTNDHLEPAQMLAASSTLVLVAGIGLSLGPVVAATLMALVGPAGFFLCLVLVHTFIGAFAVYRMTQRPGVPVEEQNAYVGMPMRSSPVAAVITSATLRDSRDRDLARWSRM